LGIIVVWALVARFKRLYAMPAAVLVTVVLIALTTHIAPGSLGSLWPDPILIAPHVSVAGIVSLGIPLFIVTMASQNLPGIAVLSANGYKPNPNPLFTITGVLGLIAAPFGGNAINLAAITAAICAGPEADPDPKRRYWAAVIAGAVYILFGL